MIALLSMLALLQAGAPQEPPPAPAPRVAGGATLKLKGADVELLKAVRAIAGRVAVLRGEPFDRPPLAVRTPDDMRDAAATIRALNVLRRERLEARGRAWTDVGLGDGSSPRVLYQALAVDLAGVGFDPEGNRLLVAPDRLSWKDFAPIEGEETSADVLMMTGVRIDEPLVGHSLMHVRQRERSGADSLKETTDALLASSAWAEGEANLVAIRYLFAGMGLADVVLEQEIDPADVLDGVLYPPGLYEMGGIEGSLVRFVYEEGFFTAVELYRSGGWDAVDAAIRQRKTTADVLHAKQKPVEVASIPWPDLPQAQGLTLVDEDSLGEQAIVVLVSRITGKDNLALQAGDGWAGDRLFRWEPAGGEVDNGITLWVTRWRDEQAAQDFDYAMRRTLQSRFPGRPPVTLDDGQRVIQTSGQVIRLQRSGLTVHFQVSVKELDPLPSGAFTGGS